MEKSTYKNLRETLGTQKEVAEILGITRAALAKRESPKSEKIVITTEMALAMIALTKGIQHIEAISKAIESGWNPQSGGINHEVPIPAAVPTPQESNDGKISVPEAFKVIGLDPEKEHTKDEVRAAGKGAQQKITAQPNYDEVLLSKTNEAYMVALNHVSPIEDE